jgi:hypothetical protein
VIPIEIKSGVNVKSNSLKKYISDFEPDIAYRYSLLEYSKSNIIVDLPIYSIGMIGKIQIK